MNRRDFFKVLTGTAAVAPMVIAERGAFFVDIETYHSGLAIAHDGMSTLELGRCWENAVKAGMLARADVRTQSEFHGQDWYYDF